MRAKTMGAMYRDPRGGTSRTARAMKLVPPGEIARSAPGDRLADALESAGSKRLLLVEEDGQYFGAARLSKLRRLGGQEQTVGELLDRLGRVAITEADTPQKIVRRRVRGAGELWHVVVEDGEVMGVVAPGGVLGTIRSFSIGSGLPGNIGPIPRIRICCQGNPSHWYTPDQAKKKGILPGARCDEHGSVFAVCKR